MNKLIYEGFETEQLSESINNSSAKRLIQELNFKYGLKVIEKLEPQNRWSTLAFLMVDPSGLAVAKVWTDTEDGVDVYNYRSPFYRKDRGSDSADRETIHSKKLSTLMATLKRNNVVPPSSEILNYGSYCAESFNQAIGLMDSHHGRDYKQNTFSADDVHLMLKAILLRENPNELNLDECKKQLDKWDEQDRIKVKKREDIERFFNTEFYAIGADKLNHLVIGSVKRMPRQGHDNYKFDMVKPFKRVKDIPDEFKAVLTMNKVHMEGKNDIAFYANFFPQANGYNPDLDLINVCYRRVDEFNLAWTLVPCSTL